MPGSNKTFITVNNLPNLKVVAMLIVGAVLTIYTAVAPAIGLPTIDVEFVRANAENIISGTLAVATGILTLVAYFKKPGQNDGVKEVKK